MNNTYNYKSKYNSYESNCRIIKTVKDSDKLTPKNPGYNAYNKH